MRRWPSECEQCMEIFLDSPLMQAKARWTAGVYGPKAAEAEVNEALEEEHLEHST